LIPTHFLTAFDIRCFGLLQTYSFGSSLSGSMLRCLSLLQPKPDSIFLQYASAI